MKRIFSALIFALLCCTSATAQGCGSSNPNCVVPDRPPGDSTNSAANTKFVTAAIAAATTAISKTCPAHQFVNVISGVGSTCAQPSFADISGTLAGSQFGPLTGDVTTSNYVATIANNAVTNAKLATATQNTVKGAATSTAVTDLTMPSCSATGNALQWTTNTGFNCASGAVGFLNSKNFGAKADVVALNSSVTCTSGSPNITVTSGTFTVNDQTKLILINGCGASPGVTLYTSITTVSSATAIIVANSAGQTLTATQTVAYGTNDTSALQSWINACQGTTNFCVFDSGNYAVNAPISVTNTVSIIGANPTNGMLFPFSINNAGFSINSNTRFGLVSGVGWDPLGTQTDGSLVLLFGTNQFWRFRDLFSTGSNAFKGLIFTGNSSAVTVDNVSLACQSSCIDMEASVNDGVSDSKISNSYLFPTLLNATGIFMVNVAGLSVTNTKMQSSGPLAFGVQWSGTSACTSCSDLTFSNMSVEVNGTGLSMRKGTATGNFGNITITGGEWSGSQIFDFAATTEAGYFNNIAITGVVLGPISATFSASFGSVGSLNFTGNTTQGFGSTTVGITVGANTTGANCTISSNTWFGTITTPITDSTGLCAIFPTPAWTAFTPTFTCGTGTASPISGKINTQGKRTYIQYDALINAIGTCSGNDIQLSTPKTAQNRGTISGRDINTNTGNIGCWIEAGTTTFKCRRFDGSVTWAVNTELLLEGVYENQ